MSWPHTWKPEDAWTRLRAADPPEWVLRHTAAVEGLARAMARRAQATGLDVDVARVRAGAILHDIGRSRVQDATHAAVGADILESDATPDQPVDEAIVRIVARHTGAGLLPEEAMRLGLAPDRTYVPESLEERIVAAADNLYSGDRRLRLADVQAKYHAKGLDDAYARIEALHEAMCTLLDTDLETLAPVPSDPT